MKLEKDYYFDELFSVSDKPINLFNPDRDKNTPINSFNETETSIEDCARINQWENLLRQGKRWRVKMWCIQIAFISVLSTLTSLIPYIKIEGPNPDWQKYIALYVLVALPSFDIGLAIYRAKARRNEKYFNLHTIELLPKYEKTVRWETFLSDFRISAKSDDSLRPYLAVAENIKFPRKGTQVHSYFYQKKLTDKINGCSNYETLNVFPTILSVVILLVSFALQLYLSISYVVEVDPSNVQRIVQVIIFPIFIFGLFLLLGFFYGSIRFEHELNVLELAFIYGGYCRNEDVEWHKVGKVKNINKEDLGAYLKCLCSEARKNNICIISCQIRISLIEGEYVIETTSKKNIQQLSAFIKSMQNKENPVNKQA